MLLLALAGALVLALLLAVVIAWFSGAFDAIVYICLGAAAVVFGIPGAFMTAAGVSGMDAFKSSFHDYAASEFSLDIPADKIPIPGDSNRRSDGESQSIDGRMDGKLIEVKLIRHGDTWDVYVPGSGPYKKLSK
jgi:hypothetical protein